MRLMVINERVEEAPVLESLAVHVINDLLNTQLGHEASLAIRHIFCVLFSQLNSSNKVFPIS